MKKIRLQKIELSNFKGIRSFETSFTEKTDIYGDNGTGKTTLFDAFTWLLFGKDHNDNTKFEIKTLDANNNAIEKVEHSVKAILSIDDEDTTIERIYREKWVKRRGSTEAELTGHETAYLWNDVPLNQKEFNAKISSIIDESVFKLVTNPLYFNTMKWQDRRALLTEISGTTTDEEIAQNSKDFQALLSKLSNKTLDEYKKEVSVKKKKIKTELEQIPTRVDELHKSLPDTQNWEEITAEIETKQKEVSNIDEQLQDQSKVSESFYKEIEQKQNALYELKSKKSEFEHQASNQISEKLQEKQKRVNNVKFELSEAERKKNTTSAKIYELSQKLDKVDTDIVSLRNQFTDVNKKVLEIDEHQFTCPTCKRAFEDTDIEQKKVEMTENFNINKANELEQINQKGKALSSKKEDIANEIKELQNNDFDSVIDRLKKKLEEAQKTPAGVETIQAILKDNKEYQSLVIEIEKAEKELEESKNTSPKIDNETIAKLKEQKAELFTQIDRLKEVLGTQKQIEQGNKRIAELNAQSKELAQALADVENEEFTITAFASAKINHIEQSVNNLFTTVKFKMFSEQLNGGVAETCETLINGVPFSDANNASKIQSGIDIINVLSKYYNFYAPIFIDNAESVTSLPNTESQVIRLIVEKGTKKLTIK